MYSIHLNMLNKEIKRFFEKPFPDEFLRINKLKEQFYFFSVLGQYIMEFSGQDTLK